MKEEDVLKNLLTMRSALYDTTTTLPSYHLYFERLKNMAEGYLLGIIVLRFSDVENIESIYGCSSYEEIIRETAFLLNAYCKGEKNGEIIPAIKGVYDDQFCIFIPYHMISLSPATTLQKIGNDIISFLSQSTYLKNHKELTVHCGFSILPFNPTTRFERAVHKAIEEASKMTRNELESEGLIHQIELKGILTRRAIHTVFHPIYKCENGEIVAFEALSRGPQGTKYESPETLFNIAKDANLSLELDRLCKEMSFKNATRLPCDCKLFINTLMDTLSDERFSPKNIASYLEKSGINPTNMVWELTERQSVSDLSRFIAAVKEYINFGITMAIDDVGAGYSSIQTITHVNPKYLKIDLSLIQGIDQSLIKQEVLSSLLHLANGIGAMVIAEGVETKEELSYLKQTGVQMAQGYLWGQPSRGLKFKNGMKNEASL